MGFEVKFNYYNKIEDSFEYNRDEPQEMKKNYGKWNDDYTLEKLAAAIMQQMARRDIFVFDVEIFEFQKKKISFKQNKSDLIIKNKKFTNKGEVSEIFEEGTSELTSPDKCYPPEYDTCNVNVPQPSPQIGLINLADNRGINNQHNLLPKQPSPSDRVIKEVVFMPSKMIKPIGAFTIEKKYPVFRETFATNGVGMLIETTDDRGARVKVPDEHFVPAQQSLVGGNEINFGSTGKGLSDDGLNWGGVIKDTVPKLR